MGSRDRGGDFGAEALDLPVQRHELGLELEDALDTGEVEALVSQILDAAQDGEVGVL